MDTRFNDTQSAGAPAGTLSEVITDYASYRSFNPVNIRFGGARPAGPPADTF